MLIEVDCLITDGFRTAYFQDGDMWADLTIEEWVEMFVFWRLEGIKVYITHPHLFVLYHLA